MLHGEAGYEMYSLAPFRSPSWTPGLYLAVGSFYATTDPEGHVYCELCRSADYGASCKRPRYRWHLGCILPRAPAISLRTGERLAPHRQFIPLGSNGTFDSHTCYAAPPILDPADPTNSSVLLYYAGGNGPHSGGGAERGRRDFMALAHAKTESLAGLRPMPHGSGVGTLRTPPVIVAGGRLILRLGSLGPAKQTAAAGVVHVRLLPAHDGADAGSALRGSAHVTAGGAVADRVDGAEVRWESGGGALLALQGRSVRIELTIRGAVLFSFGFQ